MSSVAISRRTRRIEVLQLVYEHLLQMLDRWAGAPPRIEKLNTTNSLNHIPLHSPTHRPLPGQTRRR
jgi:hypothetical protein